TKYELSARGGNNASLPAHIRQAYDDAYVFQGLAEQLASDAETAESALPALQTDAAEKRSAADQAQADRTAAQQHLNSIPTAQSAYNAYWNALGGVPASLQGQINALNAQIDQYYIAAQNDPANAHNYAIL